MYCEGCGNIVQDGHQFCMNCGMEIVYKKAEEQKSIETDIATEENVAEGLVANTEDVVVGNGETHESFEHRGLYCSHCGFECVEGEKYCISCGSKLVKDEIKQEIEVVREEELLIQRELFNIFNSNRLLSFIMKFSWIFILVYPIYLLMGRFDEFGTLYENIENVSTVIFYAYHIGLLCSYANKNFIGLFVALSLRILNSGIIMCQSTSFPWMSIFRIAVICAMIIFVYNKLMTESQRKELFDKLKF